MTGKNNKIELHVDIHALSEQLNILDLQFIANLVSREQRRSLFCVVVSLALANIIKCVIVFKQLYTIIVYCVYSEFSS